MGAVTFDQLYDNYNLLSEAKDKASEVSLFIIILYNFLFFLFCIGKLVLSN